MLASGVIIKPTHTPPHPASVLLLSQAMKQMMKGMGQPGAPGAK
jgi:hypothetical protein